MKTLVKLKVHFSSLLLVLLKFAHSSNSEGITSSLNIGCTITTSDSTVPASHEMEWYEMPLPHLICTGANQTQLVVEALNVQTVKSITLSETDLVELHIDDLKVFISLQKLKISSNRLQRVIPSKENLLLPNVTYVSFTNNFLSFVPTQALQAFPNLNVLVLHKNVISQIYQDDFRFNLRLMHLFLGWNPILTFRDEWMSTTHLNTLHIRGCKLKKIPERIKSLSTLQFADLSENLIEGLPANAFSSCTSLQRLQMASNKIKNISIGAFNGLRNLAILDLSDNFIDHLSEGTFDHFNKDDLDINLYENPISCNCKMAWITSWLEDMKDINIATEIRLKCNQPARNHGRKFHQLSSDDFTCQYDDIPWRGCGEEPARKIVPAKRLSRSCPTSCVCYDENGMQYSPKPPENSTNVEDNSKSRHGSPQEYPKVKCSDAALKRIPNSVSINVKTLSLHGNKLNVLKVKHLKPYKNLIVLDVRGNHIRTILADTSVMLPKVTSLSLNNNNLTYLDKTFFYSFPKLRMVEFYHNKINEIPNDLFMYTRNLQRLYAGPNPLKSFQEDFLETLNLKSVVLRNISLTEIPTSLDSLEEMRTCVLSDNFITKIKNYAFSKCSQLDKLLLNNNQIATIEPNAFVGATVLRYIDLSENRLTTLSPTSFLTLSLDELRIELLENPLECDCGMKKFKTWIEEAQNTDATVDVRFLCKQPLRMHNLLSHKLSPKEFVCREDDVDYLATPGDSCLNPIGGIVAAVAVTFIVCVLVSGFLLRKFIPSNRHRMLFNDHSSNENIVKLQNIELSGKHM